MDRLLLLAVAVFGLSACAPAKTESRVFNEGSQGCTSARSETQFLVRWEDGSLTRESALSKEDFFARVLRPNLENIRSAEYDYRVEIAPLGELDSQNASPSEINNWGILQTNAQSAWARGYRGNGVTVAVIDSGVDTNHVDLVSNIKKNSGEIPGNGIDDDRNGFIDDYSGYNYVAKNGLNDDESGHGTHVSGIIAAKHNDNQHQMGHMQGVAPGAKIMALDFIAYTSGMISDAILAIQYAAANGAHIINASWGGSQCSNMLREEIGNLAAAGILFVAASGNSGLDIDRQYRYPAAYSIDFAHQITVGSVGSTGFMSSHSNYGDKSVNLFAPGFEIFSTTPNDEYAAFTGTSMATPFVSGAAALLKSARPSATPNQIRDALLSGVDSNPQYRNTSRGRLNIGKALDYLLSH